MSLDEARSYLQVCCEEGIFEARDIEQLDDIELLVFAKRTADDARITAQKWGFGQ